METKPIYKVYDPSDNYLGILNDVSSTFSLPSVLNTNGAAIQIELARNADSREVVIDTLLDNDGNPILDNGDFEINATSNTGAKVGPSSLLNHNNRVDVLVGATEEEAILDNDGNPILDNAENEIIGAVNGDGNRKFTGFISDISINYGGTENTTITVMSFGYDLDQYLIQNGADTKVVFSSVDPTTIVEDALDDFAVASGSSITYDASTVETTGSVVSYTFNVNTYLEVIQKAVELAPTDWFWYLDMGSNYIHFKPRPTTVSHYFYVGKHIQQLDVRSSIEEVVNDVVFSGGDTGSGENLLKRVVDTPATGTRRGLKRISDNRVTIAGTAVTMADGEIDRYNLVQYRSTVTILAAEYPINTISLGELISFRNAGNFIDDLELQIVGLTYNVDNVVLEVGTLLPKVNKRIEDIRRNMMLLETENNPDAPT